MSRYSRGRDPYWLTARFDSKCKCDQAIRKGDRGFYYPNTKTLLCAKCSDKAAAEFSAAVADEAFMGGGCL